MLRTGAALAVVLALVAAHPARLCAQAPARVPPSAPGAPAQAGAAAESPAGTLHYQFESPAGVFFFYIKPDRAADFEAALAELHTALTKSADPRRRKQLAGWKVYRAADPVEGAVLFVFVIDPAVKGADYTMSTILLEGLGASAAPPVWQKYRESWAKPATRVSLQPIREP